MKLPPGKFCFDANLFLVGVVLGPVDVSVAGPDGLLHHLGRLVAPHLPAAVAHGGNLAAGGERKAGHGAKLGRGACMKILN